MQRKDRTFCLSQRNFTIALTCVTLLLLFIADLISRWNINQIFKEFMSKKEHRKWGKGFLDQWQSKF